MAKLILQLLIGLLLLQGERLFELKRIKQSVRGEAWDSHKVMFQIPDVEQNGNPDVNMN